MIINSLKREENSYIVNPVIKKFCKDNSLKISDIRDLGINTIEEFYKSSDVNKKKVNEWLDKVIKEGIKYSYIRKIKDNEKSSLFKSEVYWEKFINEQFLDRNMTHINESKFENDLKLYYIKVHKNDIGVFRVDFNLGLLVYEVKRNEKDDIETSKIVYPIFVELNVLKNAFEIRLKSKSRIYKIKSDKGTFEEKTGNKVTTDNISREVIIFLKDKLKFDEEDINVSKSLLFKSYYKLLDTLTVTPKIVLDKICIKKNEADKFAEKIFEELHLNKKYSAMAKEDLTIWLEKFISLSEPNKQIFMENRAGYPIKLIATDSDDTRVEEASANKEPLQTKPSYFDHKKILQREKMCDGISVAFNRNETLYYGNKPFTAVIYYKNGFGIVRFQEYVEEGDIQNVLSRIIKNI